MIGGLVDLCVIWTRNSTNPLLSCSKLESGRGSGHLGASVPGPLVPLIDSILPLGRGRGVHRVTNGTREGRGSTGEAVGDRQPAVAAERLRGDADAWRRLAALVLGAVDERDHIVDDLAGETLVDQLLA